VGSLDTGDLNARLRKTPGIRRDGLIAKKIEGGGLPKGKARIEHEKPEGRESQEGRGAGVISPITQATALEAGRKPLKVGSKRVGAGNRRLGCSTAGGENDRRNPERIRNEGETPEGETLNAAAG